MVLFEAPHRVRQTVGDLVAILGPDRRVAIGRELTKVFEEVWRGSLAEAVDWLATDEPRGEYVLVVEGGGEPGPVDDAELEAALRRQLDTGLDKRAAISAVAGAFNAPKRRVYEVATRL